MAIFTKKPENESEVQYKTETPSSGSAPKAVQVPTILVQPRISEKSGHLASINKYVFKVKTGANKVEVKKAVESFYKVKVIQVNIVTNQGKARNFGRTKGMTQAFKKAIVTLKKGDKIEGLTDAV
jgi:large subunit ribosomal protein L23